MRKILYSVLMALSLAWISPLAAAVTSVQSQTQAVDDYFASQRTHLVQGLDLKPAQQKQLDAIFVQTRPKLLAISALPAAEQAVARRKRIDDMHLRINEMLTPDQRAAYELMQAKAQERRNAQATVGHPPVAPGK
jgi:Spy/CpxP family protein refolding chaperone